MCLIRCYRNGDETGCRQNWLRGQDHNQATQAIQMYVYTSDSLFYLFRFTWKLLIWSAFVYHNFPSLSRANKFILHVNLLMEKKKAVTRKKKKSRGNVNKFLCHCVCVYWANGQTESIVKNRAHHIPFWSLSLDRCFFSSLFFFCFALLFVHHRLMSKWMLP